MASVQMGTDAGDRLTITAGGYQHLDAADYWDGNWLFCRIQIDTQGLTADYGASLRTNEFLSFLEGLRDVNATLTGSAGFATLENQLEFRCEPDKWGHIAIKGRASPSLGGFGSRLDFELLDHDGTLYDQTILPTIIGHLEELLREYPVRGIKRG